MVEQICSYVKSTMFPFLGMMEVENKTVLQNGLSILSWPAKISGLVQKLL